MVSTRYILIVISIILLGASTYFKSLMELSFALSSLFILVFYEKFAFRLGFTKDILSRVTLSDIDIDGKEHIFNLQGFNAGKVSDSITKIFGIQFVIFIAIFIFNVFLLDIEPLGTIICGLLIPLFCLWVYLMLIAESIKEMKIGTTTIKVIP